MKAEPQRMAAAVLMELQVFFDRGVLDMLLSNRNFALADTGAIRGKPAVAEALYGICLRVVANGDHFG